MGAYIMPWQDYIGRVFQTRDEIKEIFGGDNQKGIENSQIEQTVVVVSNPFDRRYDNRHLADGSYQYYGQRAQRDADAWFGNNNRKLRDHAANGRSVLLFIRDQHGIRFDGEWLYDRHFEIQVDFEDRQRPHVVFILVRADGLQQEHLQQQIDALQELDEETVRERAIQAGSADPNVRARAVMLTNEQPLYRHTYSIGRVESASVVAQ